MGAGRAVVDAADARRWQLYWSAGLGVGAGWSAAGECRLSVWLGCKCANSGQYQIQQTVYGQQRMYTTPVRVKRVERLTNEISPTKTIKLGKIMNDLRDLELLDMLDGRPAKSACMWIHANMYSTTAAT